MEEIRSAIEKASGYLAENPDAATATDAAATAVRELTFGEAVVIGALRRP